MEIFNFEVVNLNRFIKLIGSGSINISLTTVQQFQLITDHQFPGGNPTLALYEEGVADSSGKGFTPDLQVHQFVLFVAEKTNNTLQGTLASLGIFSPYQLIRLDFFDRNQTIYGTDSSSCQHHTILALLMSTRPMPSPGGRAAVSNAK